MSKHPLPSLSQLPRSLGLLFLWKATYNTNHKCPNRKIWANRSEATECCVWSGCSLFSTHGAVLDTSKGGQTDLFKFYDKYGKDLRSLDTLGIFSALFVTLSTSCLPSCTPRPLWREARICSLSGSKFFLLFRKEARTILTDVSESVYIRNFMVTYIHTKKYIYYIYMYVPLYWSNPIVLLSQNTSVHQNMISSTTPRFVA